MYDATRRRNYSPAGERFRKEHKRHRDWGLEQRHRKKLCDLYGSVEAAEAYFARRAREACTPRPSEPRAEQVECPVPAVERIECGSVEAAEGDFVRRAREVRGPR